MPLLSFIWSSSGLISMQARKGRTTTPTMTLKSFAVAIPLSAILWVALYQGVCLLLTTF
jgi:hypothetical protein